MPVCLMMRVQEVRITFDVPIEVAADITATAELELEAVFERN